MLEAHPTSKRGSVWRSGLVDIEAGEGGFERVRSEEDGRRGMDERRESVGNSTGEVEGTGVVEVER